MTSNFVHAAKDRCKIGQRVRPCGWGYGVTLGCANSAGTVVGFGRKNLYVRFDCETYSERYPHRSVQPEMLRICDDEGKPLRVDDGVQVIHGSDGLWWWTRHPYPSTFHWNGADPIHTRGFESYADALIAAAKSE